MQISDYIAAYLRTLADVGVGYSYPGQVEDTERKFLESYLADNPTAVVFDVGANVGNYTRTIKALAPDTQIFAFEPHPETFKVLSSVAQLNNVRVFEMALGEREDRLKLFDLADGSDRTLASLHEGVIEELHHQTSRAFDVQVRTVDSMIQELGVARINLLKVDAEGHELSVFKGAGKALQNAAIDVVQFEFNEMNVISRTFFKDFYDLLKDFLLVRLTPHGALPFAKYSASICEVFCLQTIVGFRRDLVPGD